MKLVKSVDSRTDPIFAREMVAIIRKEKPTAIVIGAVDEKWIEAHQQQAIIVDRISKKLDIPMEYTFIDEAASTIESRGLLREISGEMGLKGVGIESSKNLQDLFAAIVILKRFLEYYKK